MGRGSGWLAAVAIGAVLAAARPAAALDPAKPPEQYLRATWRVGELPSDMVRSLAESPEGYLWIGTQDGLARFDGVRFTVFDRGNVPGMMDSNIAAVVAEPDGGVWFGSDGNGGLMHRDAHGRFKVFSSADGLASDSVRGLLRMGDGTLIVANDQGRVARRSGGAFARLSGDTGVMEALSVAVDATGVLWVGSREGLARASGDVLAWVGEDPRPRAIMIPALLADADGGLWVGTIGRGLLHRAADGAWRAVELAAEDGARSERVTALLRDRDGNLWAGTLDAGLFRVGHDGVAHLGRAQGLPGDYVTALLEDRDGDLWVGLAGGGLVRLRDGPFVAVPMRDGRAEQVTAVATAPDGSIWVGGRHGLVRMAPGAGGAFDPRTIARTEYGERDGLPAVEVQSLSVGRGGRVLAVARDRGLYQLRGRRFVPLPVPTPDAIRFVVEDAAGTLWVGSKALYEGRDGVWRAHGEAEGFLWPRTLHEGPTGRLWVGSDMALHLRESGGFRRFAHAASMRPWAPITAIHENPDGTLWLATFGGGLRALRDGSFTSYASADGLPSDRLFHVAAGGAGELWLLSGRGVIRFRVPTGPGRISPPTLYGLESGVSVGDLVFRQPAGTRAPDGRLWFAATGGPVVVDPARLAVDRRAPLEVVIEEVRIDGAVAARAEVHDLPAGRHAIQIRYTAPSLSVPERVRFRYRLAGHTTTETDWTDAGDRRDLAFDNLSVGAHRLEVAASYGDGPWTPAAARIFVIAPPFHRTAWFALACAVALALVVLGGHRVRVARVHAAYRAVLDERARIAREIHDGLSQGLVAVSARLERARDELVRDPRVATEHVDAAADAVAVTLRDARRSIHALRSEAMSGATLPDALRKIAAQFPGGGGEGRIGGAVVRLSVAGNPRRLRVELEDNLLRIAQEAVANAQKHARASAIDVTLEYADAAVRMTIRDDGVGLAANASGSGGGQGLAGMRERAAAIAARLDVAGSPSGGTTIRLEVGA